AEQAQRPAARDQFAEAAVAALQVQLDRGARRRAGDVGQRPPDRTARTDHQHDVLAHRVARRLVERRAHACAELAPRLGYADQPVLGPRLHCRTERAPVGAIVGALVFARVDAAGPGRIERLAVILVEAAV